MQKFLAQKIPPLHRRCSMAEAPLQNEPRTPSKTLVNWKLNVYNVKRTIFCEIQASESLTFTSFYVDDDPPAIGIVHKNGKKSEPRGDFSIHLE